MLREIGFDLRHNLGGNFRIVGVGCDNVFKPAGTAAASDAIDIMFLQNNAQGGF